MSKTVKESHQSKPSTELEFDARSTAEPEVEAGAAIGEGDRGIETLAGKLRT